MKEQLGMNVYQEMHIKSGGSVNGYILAGQLAAWMKQMGSKRGKWKNEMEGGVVFDISFSI
ncbi:MAG: hypothetical protein IT328_24220 [Caldilineaceae bacterium]|nr:hypothetical protein [Caldilineaceae bacterium]